MQGQIFADTHRYHTMREGGEDGHFWCKKGIGRKDLSSYFTCMKAKDVVRDVSAGTW